MTTWPLSGHGTHPRVLRNTNNAHVYRNLYSVSPGRMLGLRHCGAILNSLRKSCFGGLQGMQGKLSDGTAHMAARCDNIIRTNISRSSSVSACNWLLSTFEDPALVKRQRQLVWGGSDTRRYLADPYRSAKGTSRARGRVSAEVVPVLAKNSLTDSHRVPSSVGPTHKPAPHHLVSEPLSFSLSLSASSPSPSLSLFLLPFS
jgi:hypothetical protein